MTTALDIQSDLTLEIGDEHISPDIFVESVNAFFGALKALSEDFLQPPPQWNMKVRSGSNLIEAYPDRQNSALIRHIGHTIKRGAAFEEANETIVQEAEQYFTYNPDAIHRLNELHNLASRENITVCCWIQRDPIDMSIWNAKNYPQPVEPPFTSAESHDYSSVEGTIEMATRRGSSYFNIYEPIHNRRIQCFADEELMQQALANWGKRVEIYGIVHYLANGTDESIKAEKIIPFPDDSELPDLSSLRGILKDRYVEDDD